ncbi:hypothetical protein DBR06_SOUSAS14010043, partial [Sousa chinensis]
GKGFTETLPTDIAFVGFFFSMYSFVHIEITLYTKGFSAMITLVGFLSSVNSHVY